MPSQKLKAMLDERNVRYISINHSPAYTARETAASTFIPRREFAKTIIVDLDGEKVMVVLSASRHVNLDALAQVNQASQARLATEDEFKSLFPDCEIGAMPPFGSLYQLRVFVDRMVTEVDDLCFNAGTHEQVLRMDCNDYIEIEKPVVGDFAIKE